MIYTQLLVYNDNIAIRYKGYWLNKVYILNNNSINTNYLIYQIQKCNLKKKHIMN